MRIIVVGGGVIGLLTAIECVRVGARVDLVDQAGVPGAQATSNDRYRIVRALHRGDAALTLAGARARQGWADLEHLMAGRWYQRTGVLTVLPAGELAASLALLAAAGVTGQAVPTAALPGRYPQLRLPAGQAAVLEPDAGAVLAGEALHALASWLRAQPDVTVHPAHRVTAVAGTPVVRLADGTRLAGDGVAVAAGPWSRELLPAVASGLTLMRQTMLAYTPSPGAAGWAGSPAVLGLGRGHDAWLMPAAAGPSARLSAASACRPAPALAGRDSPAVWRDHLTGRFAGLLAGFDPAAVTGATDGYYLTDPAGLGPRLAALGPRVWTYPACGGMSFKLAPLVAAALADRVLGRPPRPAGLDAIDRPSQLATAPEANVRR